MVWDKDTGNYDNCEHMDIVDGRYISLRFKEDSSLYPNI